MKTKLLFLACLLTSLSTFADTLICSNDQGENVVVLSHNYKKNELLMNVKVDTGVFRTFSAEEISYNIFEGRNGLLKYTVLLDLNMNTLQIENKKAISISCKPYNGGE